MVQVPGINEKVLAFAELLPTGLPGVLACVARLWYGAIQVYSAEKQLWESRAMRKRLEFFIGDQPVGCFRQRGYPATPGMYRYDPYRGVGHMRFAQSLRRGQPAVCWFRRRRVKVILVIIIEEFVVGHAECFWFVHVAEVLDGDH